VKLPIKINLCFEQLAAKEDIGIIQWPEEEKPFYIK
jgi:hypothetical protein